MPYLIKQRNDHCVHVMRDGKGRDKPLKEVGGEDFTYFENLPGGVDPTDVYFVILKVADEKEADGILNGAHIESTDAPTMSIQLVETKAAKKKTPPKKKRGRPKKAQAVA